MHIRQVRGVWFSPTGSTEKIVRTIAKRAAAVLGCETVREPYTLPEQRSSDRVFSPDELVVFGTPTYAGKTPNKLLPYLKNRLHGNGAWALPVVLFGNRSYDNALAELCAVLEERGFHTIAAAAFVSRHVFTDQLAAGRPDTADLAEAERFAVTAAERIAAMSEPSAPVSVPGDANAPYYVPKGIDGQPAHFLKAVPRTDMAVCRSCGLCARMCPMGSIDPMEPSRITGPCIKCQSCVRRCPQHAKYFDDLQFLSHVAMLAANYAEPKSNAFFF